MALPFYNLSKFTEKKMKTEIENNQNHSENLKYYWFLLDFTPQKRHVPLIERRTATLYFGSKEDFRNILWEGIFVKHLAVGPFSLESDAKMSKRLYRLEED